MLRCAIIGAGRVGSSFAPYLESLGHEATLWTRAALARDDAEAAILDADILALAAPDSALTDLAKHWRRGFNDKPIIHFSGALIIPDAWSFHPLYSFPAAPSPPEVTARIALARQDRSPKFSDIVRGAANPEFVIPDADRAFYHALAVLTGNFPAFIWNRATEGFSTRLGLDPAAVLRPYFESIVDRFSEAPSRSMTGPIARRDPASARANLDALRGEPVLHAAYQAFLDLAWPEFDRDGTRSPSAPS